MGPDRVAELQRHLSTQPEKVRYINVRTLVEKIQNMETWGGYIWIDVPKGIPEDVGSADYSEPSEVAEMAHDCLVRVSTSPILQRPHPSNAIGVTLRSCTYFLTRLPDH